MVYVWYMFSKHIPCLKLFVDRHSSYAMVEGYMFLRINYLAGNPEPEGGAVACAFGGNTDAATSLIDNGLTDT